MIKIMLVLIVLALGTPMLARAQDCAAQVSTTRQALQTAQAQVDGIREEKRRRIQGFLDDAARLLAQARSDCDRAQSPLDKSVAVAKVLVAQGNISAAHLLIKAD